MNRVQLFTGAAGLAAAFTVASAGLHAQAPKPEQSSAPKTAAAAMTVSSDDTMFAQKAANIGKMEVEHGKMAASKAANAQVKAYANKLVKDHTAANNQLMAIAKRHNIDTTAGMAPSEPDWMSQTGAAFDKAYIDAQVKGHQEAIDLFDKEAKGGSDKELKAFAAKQLPGLRAHLKQAQDLQSKLGTTTH